MSGFAAAPVHGVAVNLVTGFLGAGKTTLIRSVLARRPPGERWAVLVNEFGELGVDGALLTQDGVYVKEVPGGCLCCANGVPFRIALNLLLRQARPQRLLIEPTGLGHPLQLLAQLEAPEYHGVLDLRGTLCVIDPLAARDERVRGSEVFAQQVASADLFVLNHADRAGEEDRQAVRALLVSLRADAGQLPTVSVAHGDIDPALLGTPRTPAGWSLLPPPASHDYRHAGATWPSKVVFPHDDMLTLLLALPVARLKAVLHTDQGWLEINVAPELADWRARDPAADSRIEVIVAQATGLPDLKMLLDGLQLVADR